jgi:hypothetical protein
MFIEHVSERPWPPPRGMSIDRRIGRVPALARRAMSIDRGIGRVPVLRQEGHVYRPAPR